MPTTSIVVGTTSTSAVVLESNPTLYADVIIQNLSGNNVYVGSDERVDTTTGLKIVTLGNYVNDHRGEPIWLVADGAGSDVRIQYHLFHDASKLRV